MPNDCACAPQAEADAAAKAARAAERAANKALPKADRKPIYSPEVRAKISEGLRKRWRDPAYRASRNYTASNATRLKLSEAMKAKWKDGSFRQRNTVDGLVHPNPNPNSNPNPSPNPNPNPNPSPYPDPHPNQVNGTHHSPERRAKIAESVRRKWALDKDYRNRTVEAIRRSRNVTIQVRVRASVKG